jgi:photosystem II stability/assembly factor-like uncharacterized protein
MRHRGFRVVSLAFTVIVIAGACRSPAPSTTATSTSPSNTPTSTADGRTSPPPVEVLPTGTQAAAGPTQIEPKPTSTEASPTTTPLPSWPDRWEPTGGPEGGMIAAVAVDPDNAQSLFAAGLGGPIYRSDDAGATWSPSERLTSPDCPFWDVVIDSEAEQGNIVFASNVCAGVFRSSDGGATWERSTGGPEEGASWLVQSAHAPGVLLAAGGDGQIFRSLDGALSWELIDQGLPAEPIGGIAASGPDTYWATLGSGEQNGLYRFNGSTWTGVPFGQPVDTKPTSVLVDASDPLILYVGLERLRNRVDEPGPALLYRSIDGGLNWVPQQANTASDNLDTPGEEKRMRLYLLGKGQTSGVLYALDSSGLLASSDSGDEWRRIDLPTGVLSGDSPRHLAVDPANNDNLYLPTNSAGILKSQDGGNTWRASNHGLNSTDVALVLAHLADPATLYAGASSASNTFQTSDYGDTWQALAPVNGVSQRPGRTGELVQDPNQNETLYQVTEHARAFRSVDGGISWSGVWPDFRFSSVYGLAISPSDPNVVLALKNGAGLFRSDDGGDTWRLLRRSGLEHSRALAIRPDNPDFVLSGGKDGSSAQLLRSADGGDTWDVLLSLPEATGFTDVVFDPRVEPFFRRGTQPPDPMRLYAVSSGSRGVLWFSNDGGASWAHLNRELNFSDVRILSVAPQQDGVAYAGLRGAGTWRTDDRGRSWQRLPGDPAASAAAITVDPSDNNIVYIADATTAHLYRSSDGGTTWQLLFDAGPGFGRLLALAIAPSDSRILFVSAARTGGDGSKGAVFRIDTNAPVGENGRAITGDLPGVPSRLAVHRHDARRLYALVPSAGVWKTMDEGGSWRQIINGLPDVSFRDLVTDPFHSETLYLAGGADNSTPSPDEATPDDLPTDGSSVDDQYDGIWKSTDDGNSWHKVGGSTFGRFTGPVKAIAFNPQDERVLYAAGDSGIYLSPDQGETWTPISGRLPPFTMNAVSTDGQTLYAGSAGAGVFRGTIHPLIRTADWSLEDRLSAPVSNIQIALHPDDPEILYVGAYPSGVFKTTDGGKSWRASSFGLPTYAVADAERQGLYALDHARTAPDVLYAGVYGHGVYRSDDGAASWYPAFGDAGELADASVQTLLVHPADPDIVYAATEEGVWRSVDGGRGWSEFSTGLSPSGDVRTLVLGTNDQLYAGSRGYGVYTRPAFYISDDDGWRQLAALDHEVTDSSARDDPLLGQLTSLLIQPGDSNIIYAGTDPAGVFKTVDGGTTWREQNVGFGDRGVLTLASSTVTTEPFPLHVIYAGTTSGVMRSVDGGATWQRRDSGWPSGQHVLSIAVDPADPDTLYAASQNLDATQPFGGTVMKSTDGGAVWFDITTGLDLTQSFRKILVDRFDPSTLYLATNREGVFISRDGGATWNSWNEGLWNRVTGGDVVNAQDVLQVSADGRLLYLGTSGSGVWRRPTDGAR